MTAEATQYALWRYTGLGGPFCAKRALASTGVTPVMNASRVATMTWFLS